MTKQYSSSTNPNMPDKRNYQFIRDNRNNGSVGEFLKDKIKPESKLSIVSAFFTIYAFQKLKDELKNIEHLNFLFGEPTFISQDKIDSQNINKKQFSITDNALVIPSESVVSQKKIAKECADWIKEKVSIKSMVKPNFLHGKLYHIQQQNGLQDAVAGSSNFTVNGLGLGNKPNMELNLIIDSRSQLNDLKNWFDDIWNDNTGLVEDVKEKVLEYINRLYAENAPEFIYYKTLYHIFEQYLNETERSFFDDKIGFHDTVVWNMLYNFQKDGVKGAINKINKFNGCIIADSVGLGKTFEALAVIKYFELRNDRVLVICPKKLAENWLTYRRNDKLNPLTDDRLNFDVLYHTDMGREAGKSGNNINLQTVNWGNYDLIVIDESHNFRNNKAEKKQKDGTTKITRYGWLMKKVIKAGVNTKVLLLSATPVNNNLKDLRNQIYLITEGNDRALNDETNVAHIGNTLKTAQKTFTNWSKKSNEQRTVKNLTDNLDSSFFKLLDTLTIARSRKHIKKFYDPESNLEFPKRNRVISVAPDIDLRGNFPSYDKLNKEISAYQLSVYNPSEYVLENFKEKYGIEKSEKKESFDDQATREHFLIGMMKVNFLKRLESSIKAFEITLKRTIDRIDNLQQKIKDYESDKNKINEKIQTALSEKTDEDDEELTALIEKIDSREVGKKTIFKLNELDLERWKKDLKDDRDQLYPLYLSAQNVKPEHDEKLAKLKELITKKMNEPINENNQKVVIFTAFADTANYLYDNMHQWITDTFGLHTAVVQGGQRENRSTFAPKGFTRQTHFNNILINFSPKSKHRKKMEEAMPQNGEIDILIATDCISEGQNLQDCDYLINYDIHWNPVRIIQRFGRIDRLGSTNQYIQLVNFWATDDLNQYINLKDRVEARMALVDVTATGEENLLEPEQVKDLIEDDLKFRNKQLKRLKDEVLDLEDLDENISLSDFTLDDFRTQLLNFIEKNKKQLADAPLGMYAIVPSPLSEHNTNTKQQLWQDNPTAKQVVKPGVIFCLRTLRPKNDYKEVNPLSPYFLVYVRDDGEIRYNYPSVKQILDLYRLLCQGETEAIETLCHSFDKATDNGENMQAYNHLLVKAQNAIERQIKAGNLKQMQNKRDSMLIGGIQKSLFEENNFELITWLIIR